MLHSCFAGIQKAWVDNDVDNDGVFILGLNTISVDQSVMKPHNVVMESPASTPGSLRIDKNNLRGCGKSLEAAEVE